MILALRDIITSAAELRAGLAIAGTVLAVVSCLCLGGTTLFLWSQSAREACTILPAILSLAAYLLLTSLLADWIAYRTISHLSLISTYGALVRHIQLGIGFHLVRPYATWASDAMDLSR